MPWIERVRTGQPLDAGIGIDRDNPITQGLAFALLRFEDAVSGGLATPNGTSLVPSRGGVGVKAAASSSLGASFSKSKLSSQNGAGTGDFSVLVGASPIASTTRELMFCSCNGTTEFYIAANANVGLTASSGSISPQTNTGGASGVSQSGGANGQPRIWLYTRIGIVGTLYCDGAVVATGAVSQAQMWSSASTINVGGYSGASWGVSSSVFAAAGWNRGLSEAEGKLLTGGLQNPWQLFEKERIFVPLTTGGDTYTLPSDSGSFTLTGQDSTLAFNRVLVADSGSFSITGQTATLAFNRALPADSGSFALTGQDVTLTYTPVSGATYTLAADSGSFALSGQDAALLFNRSLSADNGSFVLTGQNATLVPPSSFTDGELAFLLTYMQSNLTGLLKRWNGSAWV